MTAWHWIAIAALVLAAWMGRWEIVPANGQPVVYAHDRWTGVWRLVRPGSYRDIEERPARKSADEFLDEKPRGSLRPFHGELDK